MRILPLAASGFVLSCASLFTGLAAAEEPKSAPLPELPPPAIEPDPPVVPAPATPPVAPAPVTPAVAPRRFEVVTPTPVTYAPKRSKETHWYGWQTLAVDGGWLTLTVVASKSLDGSTGPLLVLSAYTLGAPIVHAAHGRFLTALGSVGLRLGLPIGLALVGHGLSSRHDDGEGAALGAVLGIIGAVVLDSAVLAREPKDPEPEEEARRVTPRRFSILPQLEIGKHGGGTAGVAGTF